MKSRELFSSICTEGGLLPADLLERISAGDRDLGGLDEASYHLAPGERLNEAISRSWSRLVGSWAAFRRAKERLAQGEPGTTETRERWLLPLFQELGYGRLAPSKGATEIGRKSYPITHFWQHSPIHLVGCGIDLDRRTAGVAGAARSSPHSLVQEFLTRSDEHLWGIVSNGLRLRVLRDNASLTRQAYLEFDLEAMMEGEVFSDFVLLWLLCHQSRVEAEKPESCWLERWARAAQEQGTRVMEGLRNGVESAVKTLGSGFLSCPQNATLRERLRTGALTCQEYYRQILRLVYRLIFLLAAEDRGLVPDPDAEPGHRERYVRYYSTSRLRALAGRIRGTRHTDLYAGLRVAMDGFGNPEGLPDLALPALGSFLWSAEAVPDLCSASLPNRDLLEALRALTFTREGKVARNVDFKNLGSEELGSVYESLLELHPELNLDAASFELRTAGGHERKTTGSYYTPRSLISCLLDTALDPLLDQAAKKLDPEKAILSLKVCDPACGSGHFLLAAAHRIAKRLAAVRTADEEPSPEALRTALRDVIGRSLYGVDLNPMAVELCKVSLWLEALEPGKPLSFLDHHIKCGNSLLGATPALLAKGIPDAAFQPIEGDDKEFCKEWKRRNRTEREKRQEPLFDYEGMPWDRLGDLAASLAALDDLDDSRMQGVLEKERRYEEAVRSSGYLYGKLWADAWCAAFVWKKERAERLPYPVTEEVFRRIEKNPYSVDEWLRAEVKRLSEEYKFFHWHLEFPDVFQVPARDDETANPETGWGGGFDVVLGNPPWEHTELKEKEFFALRRPDIATAANAAVRKKMIAQLRWEDPSLYSDYLESIRKEDAIRHFSSDSDRYPLCGRGRTNTYAIFAELKRSICGPQGRVGCIVPSGIATDDTTKFFFQDLVEKRSLASLYDFENRDAIFPGVHRSYKFSLLTLSGRARPVRAGADFAFFLHDVDELRERERRFTLSAEDITLINPNTRTCPIFRSQLDAEITKAVYRRAPVLVREGRPGDNPWGVSFKQGLFNMANDSHLFRTRKELEAEGWTLEGNMFRRAENADPGRPQVYLPLYEAKMIHHFNHRFGDYADQPPDSSSTQLPDAPASRLADPFYRTLPRYWVPASAVEERLAGKWDRGWLLGWRDICRSTDERTVIASVIPRAGVGHTCPLFIIDGHRVGTAALLLANFCSCVFDFLARQKVGGTHLTYALLKQLPVLPPWIYDEPCPWAAAVSEDAPADGVHTPRPGRAARAEFGRGQGPGSPYPLPAAEPFSLAAEKGDPLFPDLAGCSYVSSSANRPLATGNLQPASAFCPVSSWLLPRVLELTYTAWDLEPFARDCGYEGPPFRWDEERRFLLRCELDAAFFYLYLGSEEEWAKNGAAELLSYFPTPRQAVEHILETFPIVKGKDQKKHGEYRTKRVILEIYDEMTQAIRTGRPYSTRLDPPPAAPQVARGCDGRGVLRL